MTSEELFKWLETCPTQEWAAIEEDDVIHWGFAADGEVVVYFPITKEEENN